VINWFLRIFHCNAPSIQSQRFDQISSQWESQKNRFAFFSFGKIQFLPLSIWNLPFMSYCLKSQWEVSTREHQPQSQRREFWVGVSVSIFKISKKFQEKKKKKKINNCICVQHRPKQNRVTWKTPSSEAFVPLQELVGVLASYVPHAQMQVWSETSVVVHSLYFAQVTIMGLTSGRNLKG
jgi:hypothetical protein